MESTDTSLNAQPDYYMVCCFCLAPFRETYDSRVARISCGTTFGSFLESTFPSLIPCYTIYAILLYRSHLAH